VSAAVLKLMIAPQPHFVLLRELSALSFPWARFMHFYHNQIAPSKDDDFLQFIMSLKGFELGSRVYGVVEQTCKMYHSMAVSMFNSSSTQALPLAMTSLSGPVNVGASDSL